MRSKTLPGFRKAALGSQVVFQRMEPEVPPLPEAVSEILAFIDKEIPDSKDRRLLWAMKWTQNQELVGIKRTVFVLAAMRTFAGEDGFSLSADDSRAEADIRQRQHRLQEKFQVAGLGHWWQWWGELPPAAQLFDSVQIIRTSVGDNPKMDDHNPDVPGFGAFGAGERPRKPLARYVLTGRSTGQSPEHMEGTRGLGAQLDQFNMEGHEPMFEGNEDLQPSRRPRDSAGQLEDQAARAAQLAGKKRRKSPRK